MKWLFVKRKNRNYKKTKTNWKISLNLWLKDISRDIKALEESLGKERKVYFYGIDKTISKLRKQEQEELAGKGADLSMIDSLKKEIMLIDLKLKEIKDIYPLVIGYHNDIEEYFNKESEMTGRLKKVELKLSELQLKYSQKKDSLETSQKESIEHRNKKSEYRFKSEVQRNLKD